MNGKKRAIWQRENEPPSIPTKPNVEITSEDLDELCKWAFVTDNEVRERLRIEVAECLTFERDWTLIDLSKKHEISNELQEISEIADLLFSRIKNANLNTRYTIEMEDKYWAKERASSILKRLTELLSTYDPSSDTPKLTRIAQKGGTHIDDIDHLLRGVIKMFEDPTGFIDAERLSKIELPEIDHLIFSDRVWCSVKARSEGVANTLSGLAERYGTVYPSKGRPPTDPRLVHIARRSLTIWENVTGKYAWKKPEILSEASGEVFFKEEHNFVLVLFGLVTFRTRPTIQEIGTAIRKALKNVKNI